MTRTILTAVAAFALATGAAVAQTASDAPPATAGVATKDGGGVSVSKEQHSIDTRGGMTDEVQTIDRNQSFTSGDGSLTAKTVTDRDGSTTVTPPPPVIVKQKTTTTTSETAR